MLVYGLRRVSRANLEWWFNRIRGVEFTRDSAHERDYYDEIHAVTGGIPYLLARFDELAIDLVWTFDARDVDVGSRREHLHPETGAFDRAAQPESDLEPPLFRYRAGKARAIHETHFVAIGDQRHGTEALDDGTKPVEQIADQFAFLFERFAMTPATRMLSTTHD